MVPSAIIVIPSGVRGDMHGDFTVLDFGGYLYGMFFAGAFIMGVYGIFAGIHAIKGIKVPLAIAGMMACYLWWSGELSYFF